ncbi:hypothetical protein, conserved [Eimeria praecox]|uniref:Uncharacterized protein n=1 Tax=Eimeria praecox TaxID=51316 RepID=U6H3W2_9EIME|nr:hypothetical protein, conserved [Eimeria praecox]
MSSSSISGRRELESYMWGMVTVASFLSDFVFSGQRHHWGIRAVHMTDRWLASFALMLQCLYNVPMWFSVSFYLLLHPLLEAEVKRLPPLVNEGKVLPFLAPPATPAAAPGMKNQL